MELSKLFLLGLCYFLVTIFTGRFLLYTLKVNLKNEILNFFVGFILVEFCSFLFFIFAGAFGFITFLISFLPNIILLILFIVYKIRNPGLKFPFSAEADKILWLPSFVVFSVLTVLYFVSAYPQFISVVNLSGIIYQDLIYHGGIAQSIINFGFPVPDPQYSGKVLNYHYFTHFVTAKISYVTFTNPLIAYHIFLNFIGILFYSFLSVSLVQSLMDYEIENYRKKLWSILISLAVFFCTFWMGGMLNYSFVGAFYFSESFQWQLFLIIGYFMVVRYVIGCKDYSGMNMMILLVLLCVATVTKVSSLPLLICGVFSLVLYNVFFKNTLNSKYWGILSFLNLLTGIFIFLVFFSGATSANSTLEFNLDLVKITPVVAFFGLQNPLMLLLIYTITVLSFRFVLLINLKRYEVWFSGAVLLTGYVLSLLVKADQHYFILPAIILANFISFIYIFECKNRRIVLFFSALAFILFSFYPIGSLGNLVSNKLSKKKDYFPLNEKRLALYRWLKDNTQENEVIFTTSVLASSDDMPDNYSPAAFSGRILYLGGYRFGGLEHLSEFSERLDLVKNFSITDQETWRKLLDADINFVLVEQKGNFDRDLFKELNNFSQNQFYTQVYTNNYGTILKIRRGTEPF